jgi:molybdate transport system substrate-binding protein
VRRLVFLTVLLFAGCGSEEQLTVSAATSLKTAFTNYAFDGAQVRASFAGSDELAAQIRQGVKPDVFASANTKLPDELYKEGLVEKPVVFAANQLVLAVPPDGSVTSLADLAKPGVTIAMGAESVPVGSYTRKVLDGLPADQRDAILGNVRSNEPDVGGVVGKVATGAVDAGFVYVTDVQAAGGELKAIELPAELKPSVAYGVAVVKGAKHPEAARKFVDGLMRGAGREALDRAGFLPPPGT